MKQLLITHPPARALGLLPRRGQPPPPATAVAGRPPSAFAGGSGPVPTDRSPTCTLCSTSTTPMRSPTSARERHRPEPVIRAIVRRVRAA